MVNRGRPSKDCLPCRKRKLRCDLRQHGCGQCQRARLSCSGYRDPNALIIRDETNRTRQKASLAVEAAASAAAAALHFPPGAAAAAAIPAAVDFPWDVQARAAFFSFYVFGLSRSSPDPLTCLYQRAQRGDPLSVSFNAVGLAFMAHQQHGRAPLPGLARKKYVEAIALVNEALSTPHLAVLDSTLQAVLLLDLYEKVVKCGMPVATAPSPGSWTAHIQGALALIQMRGTGNVASLTSRQLSIRLVDTMLISFHATSSRVPEELIGLCRCLDPFRVGANVQWDMKGLLISVINLKADIRDGTLNSDADITVAAMRLEENYAAAEEAMRPLWEPVSVPIDGDNPLVFDSHYDLYRDHLATQGACIFHVMRILLLTIIVDHMATTTLEDGRTWERLARVRERVAQEVCAMVPQFILLSARPGNTLPFSAAQVLQCYAVSAPLYIAGSNSRDPALRSWVVRLMQYMADAGGMEESKRAADFLHNSDDVRFWSIYSMLGAYAFSTPT